MDHDRTRDAIDQPRGAAWGLLVGLLALVPAVAAIWAYPGFVTQDGPAHLYNAHILARSVDPDSPFRATFAVRWQPLPNWAGHLALMGLLGILSPRSADRLMTTLMLVALAGSLVGLRWVVSGRRGLATAAILAVLLGLNLTWLMGFTGFVLGAAVMPVTLAVWWAGRDASFSTRRAVSLATLTTLGYFCHVVSLGLTALGLLVLEVFTPGRDRKGRAIVTILGLVPLVPLGALYLVLMHRGGGGLAPEWQHLANPFSPRAWWSQLNWVDPITIARKDVLPLSGGKSALWCAVFAPVLWLALGLCLTVVVAVKKRSDRQDRAWWVLAALFLIGGVLGPDTLGASHGHYLPQRIVLLGLAMALPVLPFEAAGVAASAVLVVALGLQSAIVWDYARESNRTAGRILKAAPAIGTGQRVATLLIDTRTRFGANPLLHADCALGVNTRNILWSDYEARYYYFPVRFVAGLDHPDSADLEWIARHHAPEDAPARRARWEKLLERYHHSIDVVLVWGKDAGLDAVTLRWYDLAHDDGPVRVFRRKR